MSNPGSEPILTRISEGEHYNIAMCASAKKLIRIIWVVEKNKKPFQV
jgi:hypothetical protein